MQVDVNAAPKLSKIDNLFLLLAEGEKPATPLGRDFDRRVGRIIEQSRFSGKSDESITLLDKDPRKLTLIGLGKASEITPRSLRAALYGTIKTARRMKDESIAVGFSHRLRNLDDAGTLRFVTDLVTHAAYRYDRYRTKKNGTHEIARCVVLPPAAIDRKLAATAEREAAMIAGAVRTVRDLGNGPPNLVTPTHLAERAREIAKEIGVKCTIFDRKQIEKMKMGGLLAVNRGSAEEPRVVVLDYSPRKARKTICLVGKGITFDSGGISIKPAEKMDEMKFDMCGAAAVIGSIEAAARLGLPYRLIGIIPSTDNLPSGSAYKPGDIITMMSGKTVEVVNTDAEGRMILADALHYACSFKPDILIDYATLTGACVIALGSEASGLFSNDSELAQKLIDAGEKVGERLWRLPEWSEYKDLIRSEWADMKNSGGRWGGASSAAVFLKEFVDCSSWAHLDIAGTAWAEAETPREPKGATGVGVRLTVAFLESLG